MAPCDIQSLITFARLGAISSKAQASTSFLAKLLGCSQQTASRILRKLEADALIIRTYDGRRTEVELTQKGITQLTSLRDELQCILSSQKSLIGHVQSGFGEGRYYLSVPGYKKRLKEALGFIPFPGTLNLKADPAEKRAFQSSCKKVSIPGFSVRGRTFGSLHCYLTNIDGISSCIINPERASHPDGIAEVAAEENLREKLKLKDGSKVTLTCER